MNAVFEIKRLKRSVSNMPSVSVVRCGHCVEHSLQFTLSHINWKTHWLLNAFDRFAKFVFFN